VGGPDVVDNFRDFCGPADPEIGRHIRPSTLRAMFGIDRTKNAVRSFFSQHHPASGRFNTIMPSVWDEIAAPVTASNSTAIPSHSKQHHTSITQQTAPQQHHTASHNIPIRCTARTLQRMDLLSPSTPLSHSRISLALSFLDLACHFCLPLFASAVHAPSRRASPSTTQHSRTFLP
jgi:hypothetical protein